MNTLLKSLFVAALMATLASINPSQALAQECYSVYGGGERCDNGNLSVNKKVFNPKTGNMEDNIDSNIYVFKSEDTLDFQITVQNTGSVKLNKVIVRDILPTYLQYVSGGQYFESTRTVEFTLTDLAAGESRTVWVKAKVVAKDSLPTGTTCVTNKAESYIDGGNSATDMAQVCINKEVVTTPTPVVTGVVTPTPSKSTLNNATKLPETGPATPIVMLGIATALSTLGFGIVKSVKK